MKRPDLIIRPTDWLLGLWWADWSPICKQGAGQWFGYALRVYRDDVGVTLDGWKFWTRGRPCPGLPWYSQLVEWQTSAAAVLARGDLYRQNEIYDKFLSRSGGLTVGGGGIDLIRCFERNKDVLPAWLHVVVIEHKPSQVLKGQN